MINNVQSPSLIKEMNSVWAGRHKRLITLRKVNTFWCNHVNVQICKAGGKAYKINNNMGLNKTHILGQGS